MNIKVKFTFWCLIHWLKNSYSEQNVWVVDDFFCLRHQVEMPGMCMTGISSNLKQSNLCGKNIKKTLGGLARAWSEQSALTRFSSFQKFDL